MITVALCDQVTIILLDHSIDTHISVHIFFFFFFECHEAIASPRPANKMDVFFSFFPAALPFLCQELNLRLRYDLHSRNFEVVFFFFLFF